MTTTTLSTRLPGAVARRWGRRRLWGSGRGVGLLHRGGHRLHGALRSGHLYRRSRPRRRRRPRHRCPPHRDHHGGRRVGARPPGQPVHQRPHGRRPPASPGPPQTPWESLLWPWVTPRAMAWRSWPSPASTPARGQARSGCSSEPGRWRALPASSPPGWTTARRRLSTTLVVVLAERRDGLGGPVVQHGAPPCLGEGRLLLPCGPVKGSSRTSQPFRGRRPDSRRTAPSRRAGDPFAGRVAGVEPAGGLALAQVPSWDKALRRGPAQDSPDSAYSCSATVRWWELNTETWVRPSTRLAAAETMS